MKLSIVIEHALEDYAMLFPHRENVLDHIFCTIGNGYHWTPDGSVSNGSDEVSRVPRKKKATPRQRAEASFDRNREFHRDMLKRANKLLGESKTLKQYREEKIQEDVRREERDRPKPTHFYPLYGDGMRYALVQNVPDNVQQDCLDACYEVLDLVINMPPRDEDGLSKRVRDLVEKIGKGLPEDSKYKKLQDSARAKQRENMAGMEKQDEESKKEARRILKELDKRFPGRKARTGTQRATVPRRCDPSFYVTTQPLSKYDRDDTVELKFGTGRRVLKKYKGQTVRFTVNNYLDHEWGKKMRRLLLVPEGGGTKEAIVLEEAHRFECLMVDLFPVNRRPFAGWSTKCATIRKV